MQLLVELTSEQTQRWAARRHIESPVGLCWRQRRYWRHCVASSLPFQGMVFEHLAGEGPLRWRSYTNQYISQCIYCVTFWCSQDVVLVGAGRTSRSAEFATSSELLYLLKLLYNMLIECCDDYKLIQLYRKSSVWCFTSHIHLPFS